tara:strand:+ start:631 stop:879 length:249 start_codon:yes stop_codon:yes gene_type:complete
MISAMTTAAVAVMVGLTTMASPAVQAQSEGWILGPGSRNDKNSTVVPTNCVTAEDGSVSCDTKLENSGNRTPARPYYNPFND